MDGIAVQFNHLQGATRHAFITKTSFTVATLGTLLLGACGVSDEYSGGAAAGGASLTASVPGIPAYIAEQEWANIPKNLRCINQADGSRLCPLASGFNHEHYIYNGHLGKFLSYGSRRNGINLVWADKPQMHFTYHMQGRSGGYITYGTPVAIHVKGGGFLVNQRRSRGIDLGWSSAPSYEWTFRGGSGLVDTNLRGLFNTKINDFVINCSRKYGIDLRWARDCKR